MDFLRRKGMFWITVKTMIRFVERPGVLETVQVSTWPEAPGEKRCNRHYAICRDGKPLVLGKTEWAIVSVLTKRPQRMAGLLPGALDYPAEAACPEPFPMIDERFDAPPFAEHRVVATDIDLARHMNNVAYVRAIVNAFSVKEWKRMDVREMTVIFRLVDSADSSVEYARWSQVAQGNASYSLATQLGLEISDSSVESIYAYMYIEDENGNELAEPVFFTIGNEASNNPTAGADFILAPASRSNAEASPKTIINAANGAVIPSVWTGFGLTSDGWMEVQKDVDDATQGTVRSLHIPAGRKLSFEYDPLVNFRSGNSTGRSMTLEMDVRTDNILDENEPILEICTIHPVDGDAYGIRLLPKEIYFLTQNNRVRDDQNATWAEGKRVHIAVNIVYGVQGLNWVRIFLDGRDIRSLPRDDLRRAYTMVLQDTWLFHGTIRENIAYGKPDATDEKIEAAAQAAMIHSYIESLPRGYDTLLSDNAVNLSKGQKQLLTIARALLMDSPMLILDEATSNVDTQTERQIQSAMLRLMGGRTCFVIAHRLSTIQGADQILVMDRGAIVERGTHRELLEQRGVYYELYTAQFQGA